MYRSYALVGINASYPQPLFKTIFPVSGSGMHHTLDREYSRSCKYLQLTNERLVQAELALRYWREP